MSILSLNRHTTIVAPTGDPLTSSPDRPRRLADELDREGQPALAQVTRRAAEAAERDRQRALAREGRGDTAEETD